MRPTADRVRESLFAVLGDPSDAHVLDLYAGSGALGIEALSRGAEAVVFVDRSGESLEVLRRNLSDLSLETRSRVVRSDAVRAIRRLEKEGARFDLVLADPPYDAPIEPVLRALVTSRILKVGGKVVVERRRGHAVSMVDGLATVDYREYGDTSMTHFESCEGSGG